LRHRILPPTQNIASQQAKQNFSSPVIEEIKDEESSFLTSLGFPGTNQPRAIVGPDSRVNPHRKQIVVKCDVGFGNTVVLRGNGQGMDNWNQSLPLRNVGPDTWVFDLPENCSDFDYKVLVQREGQQNVIWEEGPNHRMSSAAQKKEVIAPSFPHIGVTAKIQKQIVVKYDVGFGNTVVLRGNGRGMDTWNKSLPLRNVGPDTWVFDLPEDCSDFDYKVLVQREGQQNAIWEEGPNHRMSDKSQKEIFPTFL